MDLYLDWIHGRRRGPVAAVARAGLAAASVPYGLAVRARNGLYSVGYRKSFRAAVPVVCVGNLTVGGTGKTPCVEYVARFVREELNLGVCILSRGYGTASGPNDEALVLEENLPDVPHLQGTDRVALAMTAVEELEAEVLVLDDGFQHRRLHRDLDVVLVDASQPLRWEWLLPRGLLREPVSGLRRAGVVLLTRCDQAAEPVEQQREWLRQRVSDGVPIVLSEHRPTELCRTVGETSGFETLTGKAVAAFCGIGNPDAFRRTLGRIGVTPVAFRSFPDHHPYSWADVEELNRWASQLPVETVVLTTQKDWVKLRLAELGGRSLWAVRVGLVVTDGETDLVDRIRVAVGG